MKHIKPGVYLVILAGLGLGIIVLLLSRYNIAVQVESASPEPSPRQSPPSTVLEGDRSTSPKPSVSSTPRLTPTAQATPTPGQFRQGNLRVSNQTDHPIRVVLLYRQVRGNEAAEPTNTLYSEPVHWDFAPSEGSTKGLILSLPNTQLQLQPGDVLAAFAQDGSRRYWGPYVVGETTLPSWSVDAEEWQLILQPDL